MKNIIVALLLPLTSCLDDTSRAHCHEGVCEAVAGVKDRHGGEVFAGASAAAHTPNGVAAVRAGVNVGAT